MRKSYNNKTSKKSFNFKKVKRRRKKASSKNLIFSVVGILVFISLSAIGMIYFKTDKNKSVEVSGIAENSAINSDDLKKAVKEASGFSYSVLGKKIEFENFFASNQKIVSSLMEKFPQIENIEMKKDSNGAMIFEIKEKKPFAIWCENEKCTLIDETGIFIRDFNNEVGLEDLPRVDKKEWGDNTEYKTKIIDYVFKINQVLKDKEHFQKQFYSAFNDKIIVKGEFACELIFDVNEDISWQLEKMEAILNKEEYINNLSTYEYVDLRFKNQIIIK